MLLHVCSIVVCRSWLLHILWSSKIGFSWTTPAVLNRSVENFTRHSYGMLPWKLWARQPRLGLHKWRRKNPFLSGRHHLWNIISQWLICMKCGYKAERGEMVEKREGLLSLDICTGAPEFLVTPLIIVHCKTVQAEPLYTCIETIDISLHTTVTLSQKAH